MNEIDWLVLLGTLLFIVIYGIWKSRKTKNIEDYLLGGKSMKWWTIGLSIMATQASAITFLSTPGKAFEDGMGFIQFYFAMPLAMILIAAFVLPLYHKLKVYTAYEYIETRFDLKTRWLTSFLFMINRGLSVGLTIYAPSIILSTIMSWDLTMTNLFMGGLVVLYTVTGGATAVGQTHKLQMGIMMGGMIAALILIFKFLSPDISADAAIALAGKMGKMEIVDTQFDPSNRYNLWSGLIAGLFLFLSYFGTDQSQVQRYLSGKDIREMRIGLIFNGIFKIPMQLLILFVGVMTFVFFQFNQAPDFFNKSELIKIENSQSYQNIKTENEILFKEKKETISKFNLAYQANDQSLVRTSVIEINNIEAKLNSNKKKIRDLIKSTDGNAETNDADYVFIYFILNYLPVGMVGLLLAVIFSGAMSSTSAELNALSSATMIDVYKRKIRPNASPKHYLNRSRLITLIWGIVAIAFANMFNLFENLIELVNIIGSLFYGTILGIFLVAFFIPYVKKNAIFIAGIIVEIMVLTMYFLSKDSFCQKWFQQNKLIDIEYLWFNLIGPLLVIFLSIVIQFIINLRKPS